jgi:regulator of ribonuclease activity B
MKNIVKLAVMTLMASLALAGQAAAAQQRSPDEQAIEQLAKSGSDLTKLHQVTFLLRFPTQKAAESAEMQLIGLAFNTRIAPGKTPEERVIEGTKVMFPVESDLSGLRDKLALIAAAGRGTYEGWRAKVAPSSAGRP